MPPDPTLALIAGLIAALVVALIWRARPQPEEPAPGPPVGAICCRTELHRMVNLKHVPHWRVAWVSACTVQIEWNDLVRCVQVDDFWREYMIL